MIQVKINRGKIIGDVRRMNMDLKTWKCYEFKVKALAEVNWEFDEDLKAKVYNEELMKKIDRSFSDAEFEIVGTLTTFAGDITLHIDNMTEC